MIPGVAQLRAPDPAHTARAASAAAGSRSEWVVFAIKCSVACWIASGHLSAAKLEIIRLVEQSSLPVRHTLAKLGIPAATFYRWYDRYSSGGPEALNDRSPRPDRVWNRIPDGVRDNIIELALEEPALSQRELAVRFTDTKSYFVSEASVYR